MPHQCTDCGRAFEDGSKEMLSGCPDCGGNTFQFRPEGASDGDAGGHDDTAEPPEPPESPADSTVARTVGNAATVVRDIVSSEKPEPSEPERQSRAPESRIRPDDGREDAAQASARTEVVSPDDLPATERTETEMETETGTCSHPTPVLDDDAEQSTSRGAQEATGDRPNLSELREKLNDQFESIKVIEPGQYELNLMELYDREEYIIALQEDGKYTIQVPERWNDE